MGHVTGGSYISMNKNLTIPQWTIPLWSSTTVPYNGSLGLSSRPANTAIALSYVLDYYNGEVSTTLTFHLRQTASGGSSITLGSRYFGRQWNGYRATYTFNWAVTPKWAGDCFFYITASASSWDSTGGNSRGYASPLSITYSS